MTQLPLDQSILRYRANEERVDIFVNGNDTTTYETSTGDDVPSIRKFLHDKDTEINGAAGSILSQAQSARDTATGAASDSITAKVASQGARDDSITAKNLSQAWASSDTPPGGAGTKSAKTYALEAGAAISSATAAAIGFAEEWAQSDNPITSPAGGDGTTDRSAKYWAQASLAAGVDRGKIYGGEVSDTLADNSFPIAAGFASTDDNIPIKMVWDAVNIAPNAAFGTGSGGRFDATLSDGTWHVFAISNGTLTKHGLSKNLNPTSAPNYPSGYTKYRRIASRIRTGGSWVAYIQRGGKHILATPIVQGGGAITTGTGASLLSLSGVPTGIEVDVKIRATYFSSTVSAGSTIGSPLSNDVAVGAGQPGGVNVGHIQTASSYAATELEIRTNAAAQIRHKSGATGSLYITVIEWYDDRGASFSKSAASGNSSRSIGSAILSADYNTLQDAINAATGRRLIIEAGTYNLSSSLTGVDNIEIESNGPVIFTTSANISMLDMTGKVNWMLAGMFRFVGNATPYTGYPGSLADTGQKGIKLSACDRYLIDGSIEFENINGTGFYAESSGGSWQHKGVVKGIRAKSCYHGIRYTNVAEYDQVNDFVIDNCAFAVRVESGNILFANGKMNYNSICVSLAAGTNGHHGGFTNCQMNHSEYALSANGVTLGQCFSNCFAIANQAGAGHGKIQIIGSVGIVWNGGQMGADISVDATSKMALMNSYIRTDLTSAPSVASGGVLIAKNNVADTGSLWAYNN